MKLASSILGVSVLVAACGSSADGATFESASVAGSDGDGGTSGSASSIGSSIGATSSGASSGPGPVEGPACAAQNADAARKPAYLFFVLDQSASMAAPSCSFDVPSPCQGGGTKPACCTESEKPKRWTPITSALSAFVQDPLSKGISAGLELFPSVQGTKNPPESCDVPTYATDASKLDVPMRALPDPGATSFSTKWPETPSFLGTPTRAVLQAIGPIAKKWALDHPEGKTAIVLLTDGLPQLCSADDQKIENVASEVAKIADTVPTYVIGVSDKTENLADLQALATAGKTTLTRIDTSDPKKTQKEFLDRINEIRKSTLSCDVSLPAPPAGLTLDLQKVNVSFTVSGAKEALTYDAACAGAAKSWRFDSLDAPTKIVLCPSTCDGFEANPDGVVGVEFGCERRDVVK